MAAAQTSVSRVVAPAARSAPVAQSKASVAAAPAVGKVAKPACLSLKASLAQRKVSVSRNVSVAAQRKATVSVANTTVVSAPHGAKLVDLMAPESEHAALIDACTHTIEMSDRNACDVELLTVGGFSPLTGFLNEADYQSVVDTMRLTNGLLFGLPIVLDTDSEDIKAGDKVLLKYKGKAQAVMTVESKYLPNKALEAKQCYGTSSLEHPGVLMIATERKKYYLGGAVTGLAIPEREFPCETPAQVRAQLPADKDVVAFQCRNPIHRAHYELFIRSLDAPNVAPGSTVLVHPTCGPTQGDDIPGAVRYKTYLVLKEETNNPQICWAYLPYSMHMAGPREAIQHMIIRKNYGCTHFIIGRDMAGSKSSLDGEDFYGAYDAQDLAREHCEELGMQIVPSLNLAYTEEEGYVTADVAKDKGLTTKSLSGTKFRKALRAGEDIPEWFAFKSVVKVLRENQ